VNPKVSIIILNWNGWQDTIECLESVLRNNYTNYQVIVIDNNSSDCSMDYIKAWAEGELNVRINPDNSLRDLSYPPVRKPIPYVYYSKEEAEKGGNPEKEKELEKTIRNNNTVTMQSPLIFIQTGSNLGFAGGNNVGIRYALKQDCDYILTLNNDTIMAKDALDVMVGFMDETPSAGACGARLFYPDGSPQQSYGNFPTIRRMFVHLFPLYKLFPRKWFRNFKRLSVTPGENIREPIKVDYPSGACLMVRREVIDAVGFMDERFFAYCDETDWCYRMMKAGWERYYFPKAEILHYCGASFKNMPLERRILSLKSKFKFFKKHYSAFKVVFMCSLYILSSLYFLIHWNIAYLLSPLRKGLKQTAKEGIKYSLKQLQISTRCMIDTIGCRNGKKPASDIKAGAEM